jgi:hypothetical protein
MRTNGKSALTPISGTNYSCLKHFLRQDSSASGIVLTSITSQSLLAARVNFPWSSPTIVKKEVPADIVWIESAPEGLSVEVALYLINVETPLDDWPGKATLGTSLAGNLPLEGGGRVCVVHRNDAPLPEIPLNGSLNFFRDKSLEDLKTANRFVVWGEQPDGSILFVESHLDVKDPSLLTAQ